MRASGSLLPAWSWTRSPALRSWPALLFVALVAVPPAGLVVIGPNPTMASVKDASWLFAAYFAVAWLLLIGVIVRPAQVSRLLLVVVVGIALVTQVPLAAALETALKASSSNLLASVFTIGLPEELAKAIPIAVIAVALRSRLAPVDYLFLGAVSGLVFGASEVVHYFTNGVGVGEEGAGTLILSYVWRFLTDPVSHACWSGLTGYFIGLAASGQRRWYQACWIGLAMAMVLHGLNDWDAVNGHATWVVVVAVSGVLFLAYAKASPAQPGHARPVILAQPVAATQPVAAAQPVAGLAPEGPAPGSPVASSPVPGSSAPGSAGSASWHAQPSVAAASGGGAPGDGGSAGGGSWPGAQPGGGPPAWVASQPPSPHSVPPGAAHPSFPPAPGQPETSQPSAGGTGGWWQETATHPVTATDPPQTEQKTVIRKKRKKPWWEE